MKMVKEVYLHQAQQLVQNSLTSGQVTYDRVYQPSNSTNREILDQIIAELLLPGSGFRNLERIEKLYALSQEGKSCLILMDHYSNFDIPAFHYLIHSTSPRGLEIADSILPLAGIKLNSDSLVVRAFTEAYSRLVIYPSRSLRALEGKPEYETEKKRSHQINMAALAQMVRKKHEGHIILLFPSGTRYRPGKEETRRGLPEVDSYLRAFDYVLPIGIGGNTLRINPEGSMAEDFVVPDVVVFQPGEILDSRGFRDSVRKGLPPGPEAKQGVSDKVMEILMNLHRQANADRRAFLPPNHPADDDGVYC